MQMIGRYYLAYSAFPNNQGHFAQMTAETHTYYESIPAPRDIKKDCGRHIPWIMQGIVTGIYQQH